MRNPLTSRFSSYTLICTSTDYDAWREAEPVTVAEVVKTLHDNARASDLIAQTVLEKLHDIVADGQQLTATKGSMQYSIISKKESWPEAKSRELAFILPYFE